MEDSKTLDISTEDIKISPENIPILKNLQKLRRQSNNSTCSLATTVTSDNSENLQSCGSVCVYNLKQQLIFNCEFCDLKYGDLDNFKRHLQQDHNLFQLEEEPVKENAGKKRKSSKDVATVVKKEPLEPPIDLPPTYFTEPLVSCGAVFIFNQQKFHLACGYCDCSKYDNLDMFEKHVKQQHNILEGALNELNVVPKVEVKEEVFLITEVVEPTEVKVEKEEPMEEGVLDIKQSYSDEEEEEDEDENEEGEDDEENEIDEDDEEFIDEDDEEFIDEDDEEGEEDETGDESNTSKATKRKKQQESPSDEPSTSSSAKSKRKSKNEPTIKEESISDLNSTIETGEVLQNECDICHKQLKNEATLNQHKLLHMGNSAKNFNCEICTMKFFRKSQLKIHMRLHTGEKPYKCDICHNSFRVLCSLEYHKRLHEGKAKKVFNCEYCQMKFHRNSGLDKHLRIHYIENNECDLCHKRFRTRKHLKSHKESHKNEIALNSAKPHICVTCDKRFRSVSGLEHHKNLHLGKAAKFYNCGYCEKEFVLKSDLANHIKQQHKRDEKNLRPPETERIYKCEHCNKTFEQSFELKNHMDNHGDDKPHECDICKKRFRSKHTLLYHKNLHLANSAKDYNCKFCQIEFVCINDLTHHIHIHSGENNYLEYLKELKNIHMGEVTRTCEDCDWTFSRYIYLQTHLRGHTDERSYKCDVCNKCFRNVECLRYHNKKLHMKEKEEISYNCEYCNKKFKRSSDLKTHIHIHTGEKPYECDLCHKRFRANQNLSLHKKTHMGEASKTLQCDYCEKKFIRNHDRRIHMRSHTGERPFKCDLCPRDYTSKVNLRTHIERDHEMRAISKRERKKSLKEELKQQMKIVEELKQKLMQPKPELLKEELELEIQKKLIEDLKQKVMENIKSEE